MLIRAISQDDWQAIGEIQAECYHALAPEPLHVLKSKWQASPQTCYVLEKSEQVVGYCLAHPWTEDTPPPLYKAITTLPKADTLYLHDIAISNRLRDSAPDANCLIPSSFRRKNCAWVPCHWWQYRAPVVTGKSSALTTSVSKNRWPPIQMTPVIWSIRWPADRCNPHSSP